MERYCLDAQYASGDLPREAIYYPNSEREMGSLQEINKQLVTSSPNFFYFVYK